MKTQTLATSVLEIIGTFHKRKANFSAYDVTQVLRKLVNQKLLNVSDLAGTTTVPHTQVRQLVHEFFAHGFIGNFVASDNGTYVTYSFQEGGDASQEAQAALQRLQQPITAKSFVSPYTQPFATTVSTVTSAPKTSKKAQSFSRFNSTAVYDAIYAYVQRKIKSGQAPTLKQIQSRLKGTSITTKQIKQLVEQLGFKVKTALGRPSYSTVWK